MKEIDKKLIETISRYAASGNRLQILKKTEFYSIKLS